ncbi:MAG: McrB family protein [Anaerovoracaceae bacterium]
MMKSFQEMLVDLEELRGMPLSSISGQATPFQIEEIDRENDRILLNVNGTSKSRPLEELRKIWEVMCSMPAAHVDSVLGGSGSSRSQPETILANLPYVEWLTVVGKKNIAYVGEDTHEKGTLRKMDDDKAAEYQALMSLPHPRNPLLPPLDERDEPVPTRDALLELDNKTFIFTCLGIMSTHRLFNGYTLPILESREQCALLFRHNNIHGILFKRPQGMSDEEYRAAMQDDTGHPRYYADTYSIAEDEYYVSSQWRPDREDARGAFLDWLFELLLAIRFETGITSTFERNRIVFGAPGTGKSHALKEDCKTLLNGTTGTFERVTFHPEYTYSQFVGSYKPVTNSQGEIRYDFVPGPFMRVLVAALKSGRTEAPQPHLLLIEEINRAKVAAVFGEVFQLLDRSDEGSSEYEIHATEDIKKYLISELGKSPDSIKIPDNMFIWATMNSADQGVYPMDTAFKRRWNFEYIGIDDNDDEVGGVVELGTAPNNRDINWNVLRKAINDTLAVTYNINEDKLMGPYFLSKQVFAFGEDGRMLNPEKFKATFKSKVIMYLYEDAAKAVKHRLFEGCDSSKYSSVCAAFDARGIEIFGASFVDKYNSMIEG